MLNDIFPCLIKCVYAQHLVMLICQTLFFYLTKYRSANGFPMTLLCHLAAKSPQ